MNNRTMIQFFHWYSPGNGVLWKDFSRQVSYLAGLGISDAWLPPPYKGGSGAASIGYDVYDLFDIGEFKQQGTISTEDLKLVLLTDSVPEAMDHIRKYITSNYKIKPRKKLWWLFEKT